MERILQDRGLLKSEPGYNGQYYRFKRLIYERWYRIVVAVGKRKPWKTGADGKQDQIKSRRGNFSLSSEPHTKVQ